MLSTRLVTMIETHAYCVDGYTQEAAARPEASGSEWTADPSPVARIAVLGRFPATMWPAGRIRSTMSGSGWKAELLLAGSWRGATSVLLTSGTHHLVVDSGMPHEAPLLLKALEQRGLKPGDIEGLIATHFHVDHVLNNSLFPHIPIYASQQAHDWACSLYSDLADDLSWEQMVLKYYPETFDYERARELMGKLRKLGMRMWAPSRIGSPEQFVWIENRPLPGGLGVHLTSGHVPGHLSVIVSNGSEPIIIAGDALLSRDHDDQILTMIPYNREQFDRDRQNILAMRGRILPGHDQPFLTTDNHADK